MITQEYLKSKLHYNPVTGIFIWTNPHKFSDKSMGDKAGALCKTLGYHHITIDCKKYRAHRLAWLYMTGSFPFNQIDHKNRIKNDNSWLNLRDATNAENGRNRKLISTNKSGVSGVHFNNNEKAWRVVIGFNNKKHWFGSYKTLEEAIEVRHREIKKLDFSPTHGI